MSFLIYKHIYIYKLLTIISSCDRLPKLLAEAYEICEVQRHFAKCLKTQEVVNTVLKECWKDSGITPHASFGQRKKCEC